jgi:hypothetical protein
MATELTKAPFVRKQENFVGRYAAAMAWLSGDLPEWGVLPEWLVQEFLGEDGKIDRIIKKFGLPPERRNDSFTRQASNASGTAKRRMREEDERQRQCDCP